MVRKSGRRKPLANCGNDNDVNRRTKPAKSGAVAEQPKKKPPSSNDSWKTRKNLFGTPDKRAWYRNLGRALREAKGQVPERFHPTLDIICASKGSPAHLMAASNALNQREQRKNLNVIAEACCKLADAIKDTGVSFSEDGNVNSKIDLPSDAIKKADALLVVVETIREETGLEIESLNGFEYECRAHFGSEFTKDTTHTLQQHYATIKHEDQGCYNHIDFVNDPGCNLAALVTTPRWFVKDKNKNYPDDSEEMEMPSLSDLQDVIVMLDWALITLVNPNAPDSPPGTATIKAQYEQFAQVASSSVKELELLSLLFQCTGYLNSILRGTKHSVLICSADVIKKMYECAPPEGNSLLESFTYLCHFNNIAVANFLEKYSHGELKLLTTRLIEFFRRPLKLPDGFESNYLLKRADLLDKTDEELQLIRQEQYEACRKGGINNAEKNALAALKKGEEDVFVFGCQKKIGCGTWRVGTWKRRMICVPCGSPHGHAFWKKMSGLGSGKAPVPLTKSQIKIACERWRQGRVSVDEVMKELKSNDDSSMNNKNVEEEEEEEEEKEEEEEEEDERVSDDAGKAESSNTVSAQGIGAIRSHAVKAFHAREKVFFLNCNRNPGCCTWTVAKLGKGRKTCRPCNFAHTKWIPISAPLNESQIVFACELMEKRYSIVEVKKKFKERLSLN